jgi:molybdopterin converting factor small subunit
MTNQDNRKIRVRLRCFSHLKYVLGTPELEIELPGVSTVNDLIAHVRGLAPGKLDSIPLRAAVNQQFVEEAAELSHDDEVALIPPVQGG